MKRLSILFLLLLSNFVNAQYRNQISTFTTNDFNHKPSSLMVYVGVTNNIKDNTKILNKILALLPKETKVLKTMVYNDAWIDSEKNMILKESIKYGCESALIVTALDSEDKQQYLGVIGNGTLQLLQWTDRKYKYEMRLEYAQTQLLLWRAVTTLTSEEVPIKRMINYAIGNEVL